MSFHFERLALPDVVLVVATAVEDERGFFIETYKESEFAANGITGRFVQDNFSHSASQGVLRGLHYQNAPSPQGKLVSVIHGTVFDVAVDIRQGSPTYGRWVATELAADKRTMLWVPPGFAHGFCVLSNGADVVYKCTAEFAPQLDRGIRWDDPQINIAWPIKHPVLSVRDAVAPLLRDIDTRYAYQKVRA